MMHPEQLLMLLAIGIYLLDSVELLDRNEAVLYRTIRGRWRVAFGLSGWTIKGKEAFLPNPLAPFVAPFKLRWVMEGQRHTPKVVTPLHVCDAFSGLGVLVFCAMLGLLVLLPIGLMANTGRYIALSAVAYLYFNVSAALVLMYRRREAFGLTQRKCLAIAFECLICIPIGVNLIRKLTRLQFVHEDLMAASSRLLDKDQMHTCLSGCKHRIQEEIDAEVEGTPRMEALKVTLEKIRLRVES